MYIMLCSMSLSDWGDIGNIFLGVSSVATAIVTAIVLIKQHRLQEKQHKLQIKQHLLEKNKLNAQQMEHQPLFQFNKTDEMLTITNAGCELSAPVSVQLHSMVIVKSEKLLDDCLQNFICCHPVSYYDRQMSSTGQLKGDVAVAKFKSEDFNILKTKIYNLNKYLSNWKNAPIDVPLTNVYYIGISDVVQIDYVDMYKISRTAYFCSSQPISKTRFDQLVALHRRVPLGLYGVNDIQIEDIIERVYYTNEKQDE